MENVKDQLEQTTGVYRYGDDIYLIDENSLHGTSSLLPLTVGREITTDKIVFLQCRKGSVDLKLNYRRLLLNPGLAMIILPEMIIETLAVSDDAQVLTMLLSERFTDSLNLGGTFRSLLSVRHQPLLALPVGVNSALLNLFGMVRGLLTVPSHPNLDRVLHLLFEAYFFGIDPYLHTFDKGVIVSTAELHTDEFLKLLEKNFRQQHSIDWYAEQLHITSKRLSICVKQTTGHSATEWIDRHRLLEAEKHLRNGTMSVKEIASSLSFPNQSAFGTWFKRHTCISPTKYRNSSAVLTLSSM